MRVVRSGGQYLMRREQRLWFALASLAVIGPTAVVIAASNLWTGFMWAGILIGLIALSLVRDVLRRLTNVRKGRLGERLVTELLCRLPDDYRLVNDVMLPGTRGNIDHVLIGPCGVVVIETKRLSGVIHCYEDAWSVNGYSRGSISRQVNSNACAVRYFLADHHPDLASTALRWVESVVVFTHPLCRLKVNRSRTTVVRYSELHQLVLTLATKCRMPPDVAARLAGTLSAGITRERLRGSH